MHYKIKRRFGKYRKEALAPIICKNANDVIIATLYDICHFDKLSFHLCLQVIIFGNE